MYFNILNLEKIIQVFQLNIFYRLIFRSLYKCPNYRNISISFYGHYILPGSRYTNNWPIHLEINIYHLSYHTF